MRPRARPPPSIWSRITADDPAGHDDTEPRTSETRLSVRQLAVPADRRGRAHALRPRGERAQPVGRDAPPRSRADPARPFLHRDDERGVDGRVCRARRRDWSEYRVSAGAGIRTAARRPALVRVPAL